MRCCSSGINRASKLMGFFSARPNHSCSAGRPWSWYTPLDARSLMDTMPMRTASNGGAESLTTGSCELFTDQLKNLAVGLAVARCSTGFFGNEVFAGLAHQ